MKLFKYIFTTLLLFGHLFATPVYAENEDSELNTTESIVGDNDVTEEEHSNYVVPSNEDLEGVTQMEVVSNVNERGQVFDHEKLAGTKQFLTVVTPDGRTYYIVINYEQFGTKVHLLKDMSESDVETVANSQPQAGSMTPLQAEQYMEQNANEDTNNSENLESETEDHGPNLMIVGVILVAGGIFAFIKLKKDKKEDGF